MPKKLNPDRMHILIQGPPGVGKTIILDMIQEQLAAYGVLHNVLSTDPPIVEICSRPVLDCKAFRWIDDEQ